MKKSEATKKKILEGSLRLFEHKGFAAATTKEIAAECGVSEGSIYKYYKSKDELLKAIAMDFITGIGEKMIVEDVFSMMDDLKNFTIEEKLKGIILNRLELLQNYSSHINVLLVEVRYDHEIREIITKGILPRMTSLMEHVLKDAEDKGEIRSCNSGVLIRALLGSIVTLFMQKRYFGIDGKELKIKEEIEMTIDLFMNGIKEKNR